jgi:hypothetical protein
MATPSRADNRKRHPDVERGSWSEPEWCVRHNISLSKLRKMKLNGTAPRVTKVDGIRRITNEDDKAWLDANKEKEEPTNAA